MIRVIFKMFCFDKKKNLLATIFHINVFGVFVYHEREQKAASRCGNHLIKMEMTVITKQFDEKQDKFFLRGILLSKLYLKKGNLNIGDIISPNCSSRRCYMYNSQSSSQ